MRTLRRPLGGPLLVAALGWAMLATVTAAPAHAAPAHAAASGPAATPLTSTHGSGTLAKTPPMGFNDWNAFGCGVDEALIEQTADVFVSSGLKAAGYQYVNIDDCWSLKARGADGRMVADPAKFPDGIKGVADYVHSKGLKLGIYGDAGTATCAGYPGSLGKEALDAQTWADWGIDYLKYDNCNNLSDGTQADFIRRYTAMRDALRATGRPIVYSMSEWGQSQPWLWANGVGNLWRTTGDISDNWPSLRSIIAQNAPLSPYAGPGHWNDPDMLEIGNGGMTDTEYRTHLSMWAMMAAPLIIGTDLRDISAADLAILGNKEIIAIDQDRLGVQAAVVANSAGLMVLDKPLAGGDRAIALYNSTDSLATVSVPASATGLRHAGAYRLRDQWTGAVRQARSTISAAVPAHGTVVFRVRPLSDPDRVAPSVTIGAAALATLVPGPAGGGTLTSTVTNRGVDAIDKVAVRVRAPAGWTVTASTGDRRARLATDAAFNTSWAIQVPDGTPAGRYPITMTTTYTWGRRHLTGSTSSEIVSTVVTAPADGTRYLSTVLPVSTSNAQGPVEVDQSNGGPGEGDGSLITIAGRVYTRGFGTTSASEIGYYLGGHCSRLVTDVGIDDEAGTGVPASFTVFADDATAAASGPVGAGDGARTLTADLTGATWLRLVSTAGDGSTADHADWAAPVLTCGAGGPVQPAERTLFSFESGTEDFTIANPDSGGTVAQSPVFHTDGSQGLEVFTPAGGNWYGKNLAEPLDITGTSMLKFDVKTGATGTTGEIAVQIGPDFAWCQGSLWAWTNPNSSRTITERFSQLGCPAGVTLDPSQIRSVWVFLNGGDVFVDNIRAE